MNFINAQKAIEVATLTALIQISSVVDARQAYNNLGLVEASDSCRLIFKWS